MSKETRTEKDVLGELEVPIDAYWGINTQRAIQNFQISGKKFSSVFLRSLAQIKKACLLANTDLNLIDNEISKATEQALNEIIEENKLLDQFPIDIFQTGSGTQTNMNMNEVAANRANEILGFPKGQKKPVHPNDHINLSQSSNDIIPTTMHLSTIVCIHDNLLPSLHNIINTLNAKIEEFSDVIKVGRTHLQDAVPIPLSTEFEVYKKQLEEGKTRVESIADNLKSIPIGGTAVGTGINVQQEFSGMAVKYLNEITGINFTLNPIKAEGIASHNAMVAVSSALRNISLSLLKMANDIRWMGSGPRAGLGELILPQNEPGSSIMPGKINPTQSEMLMQVCLKVLGNDTIISAAESHGSILDLNIMKPLIIDSIIESITLLSNGMKSFNKNCLKGLKANKENIKLQMERNLMTVTILSPLIGYDAAADIAMRAFESGKSLQEIILESDLENKEELIKELKK